MGVLIETVKPSRALFTAVVSLMPARHPESHHLLNSEVHGISVQHYGSFPYNVSVCVTYGQLTEKQMDSV